MQLALDCCSVLCQY